MARRPLAKVEKVAKLGESGGLLSAAIVRVLPDGTVEKDNPRARFLLNPQSWREAKSVNWASQSVPGQSDPVKQWVAGGPRVVTFDTLVTADINKRVESNPLNNLKDAALNAVSSVASSFFNVNVPPLGDLVNSVAGGGDDPHPLNIAKYLDYYRSLTLPNISQNEQLLSSPPLIALYVGASIHNVFTETKDVLTKNGEVWVLRNLDIVITKQLPNLTPMEAVVSFQLEHYIINSASADSYALSPSNTITLPAFNFPAGGSFFA